MRVRSVLAVALVILAFAVGARSDIAPTLVSVEVLPANAQVPAGRTQQFTAIGTFSDGTTQDLTEDATWSSSDGAVATISNATGSKGLATGVAPGMTEIRASADGVDGTTTLTVTDAVLAAIDLTPMDPSLLVGGTQQLTASGTFSDGTTRDFTEQVIWSSSVPGVATISNAAGSKGVATGVAPGMTEVRASLDDVEGTTTLTVTGVACPREPLACKAAGVTKLTVRNDGDDGRDTLTFTWTRGDATSADELGDPSVDTEYSVCVWDDVGGVPTLVMDMVAPAGGNCQGRPCWRPIGVGSGFRYRDLGLLPDGIQQVTLRSGPLGKTAVLLKGKGSMLPDPPMPFHQQPSITVQVVNSAGSCWGAAYVNPPQVNTAQKLAVKEKP